MDTQGTINADIGAIEEAERQFQSLNIHARVNPDLNGSEEESSQAERVERWLPELTLPSFRRTCLTELRSYRANQIQQETRGQGTSKVSLKVHDTLLRQCRVIAEKNPHLFNDSKEFIDDFALLGINIGLYAFRRYPNAEDVVQTLSWEDEEILFSLYRETQRLKTLVMFDAHCKRAQEEAYNLENDRGVPDSVKQTTAIVMDLAAKLSKNHPHHKTHYAAIVEKYFGPQAWKKFWDKMRKRDDRGSNLAETEGDPTSILSKKHLSLVVSETLH